MKIKYDTYGVQMTQPQQNKFYKHLDKKGLKMNNFLANKRKKIAKRWLKIQELKTKKFQ